MASTKGLSITPSITSSTPAPVQPASTAAFDLDRSIRRALTAVLIIAVAAIHGLAYVFAVPPWQHYDEPSHFEYAWLIAQQDTWPKEGDLNVGMRRQVAESMLRNAFYDGMTRADLDRTPDPINLGFTQIGGAPAYYWLVARAVRGLTALRITDVTVQLYAMRFISLGLYVLTVAIACGVMRVVAPRSPLAWMVPLTLALLPAFTDLMTSVNDDVGAVFATSLFLWGAVSVLKHGLSVRRLVWIVGAAALCYFTKRTAFAGLLLLPVVVLFGLLRGRLRWAAWTGLGLIVIACLLVTLRWGDAALWFRFSNQTTGTACAASCGEQMSGPVGAHTGANAFQLTVEPGNAQPALQQLLLPDTVAQLRGKTVTVGAWMWADVPAQAEQAARAGQAEPAQISAATPALSLGLLGSLPPARRVVIGSTPTFVAMTVTLPAEMERLWFVLSPQVSLADPAVSSAISPSQSVNIYFDGVVLAEGEREGQEPPQFQDETAQGGAWGGQPFVNLIRNGSAERTAPFVEPKLNAWAQGVLKDSSPALMLGSILDWRGAWWYYEITIRVLVESFWARFGWGHVTLAVTQAYTVLAGLTIVGVVGALVALARQWRRMPWSLVVTLGLAIAATWFFALTRGLFSLFFLAWIPVARYAAPVVIPIAILLNAGWLEAARIRRFDTTRAFKVVYVAVWVAVAALSLYSLIQFYAPRLAAAQLL